MTAATWEWDFVTGFWWLVHTEDASAGQMAAAFERGAFEEPRCWVVFQQLCEAQAEGAAVLSDEGFVQRVATALHKALPGELGHVEADALVRTLAATAERVGPARQTRRLARLLWEAWRARTVEGVVATGATAVAEARRDDPARALEAARDLASRVEILTAGRGLAEAPRSRAELMAAERALVLTPQGAGNRIAWPYPVMQKSMGFILPGRLYGITAYSGAGKSTLLSNLFTRWTIRGSPCIPVVTEMGDGFIRRALAADSETPQEVAENSLWDSSDPELIRSLAEAWSATPDEVEGRLRAYRDRYLESVTRFEDLPFEPVCDPELTPEQVVQRLRIYRRRWPGRFVLGLIDHMHDLTYPNDDADKYVRGASKLIRDFCREDGLMSVVALYQPVKPDAHANNTAEFRPILARRIRGQVAQVLDGHTSIYKQFVYVDTHGRRTRWGTPATALDERGWPWRCDRAEADEVDGQGNPKGKVDDQHLYLKPDKRRIGGEGKLVVLGFNADSGTVFEPERFRTGPRMVA